VNSNLEKLKTWIVDRHPDLTGIAPDVDLIENRLIDSLSFVEFLLVIEQLSGRPIDMGRPNLDQVRTLNAVGQHYFANE
jgi:acyl carrier protein